MDKALLCCELANPPAPDPPPPPPPSSHTPQSLPVNCKKPSRNEIRKAIRKLKNGEAPGLDNIPAEAMKVDLDMSTEEEELPEDWKEGLVIKLPKRGDLREWKKLQGGRAAVGSWQNSQQDSCGEDENSSRLQTPQPSGRLQTGQVIY